jgi:hypothetical protein
MKFLKMAGLAYPGRVVAIASFREDYKSHPYADAIIEVIKENSKEADEM